MLYDTYPEQSTCEHNWAVNGGAVSVQSARVHVTQSVFSLNTASQRAGAMCVVATAGSQIDQSLFTNNTALGGSGGAVVVQTSVRVSVAHSVFIGNKATESGGALQFVDSDNRSVSSVRFENNDAGFGSDVSSGAHAMGVDTLLTANPVVRAFFPGSIRVTLLDEYAQVGVGVGVCVCDCVLCVCVTVVCVCVTVVCVCVTVCCV